MRIPVVARTVALLMAFSVVPGLLWSSEPPQQAEPKTPLNKNKSDRESKIGSATDTSAGCAGSVTRPLVYLDKAVREGRRPRPLAHRRILHQELYRQAFLLAAREECGAVTRDARLQDPMPTDRDNLPFAIANTNVPFSEDKPDPALFKLQIRRGPPDEPKEKVVELALEKTPQREDARATLVTAFHDIRVARTEKMRTIHR